jgi:hypothetical protein
MKNKLRYDKDYFVNMVEIHGSIDCLSYYANVGLIEVSFKDGAEKQMLDYNTDLRCLISYLSGDGWSNNPYL